MPLLDVTDLSIRFGGIVALDHLSFGHEQGQILSLIGPNGAGKTTVFNCITRVYAPDQGSITFGGKNLLRLGAHEVIAVGVARTFQNLALFSSMTVLENVLIGKHASFRSNLAEAAFRLPRATREEGIARSRSEEILKLLQLADYRDKPVAGLPLGLKKRVELARALIAEPRLLLLDEPANGLNHGEVESLIALIRSLRDDLGLTILLVEHQMALVMGVSDRICVLNFGCKIAEGTPAEVQRNPSVIEAYLGEHVA